MSGASEHLKFTTVDVFTSTRFAGNPLAIVTLPSQSHITQEQKQLIAREFNYSETVFVSRNLTSQPPTTPTAYDVAIFTTEEELPFAGHPVIGTSYFVLSQAINQIEATFNIKAGPIYVRYDMQATAVSAKIPQAFHLHSKPCSAAMLASYQPSLAPYLKSQPATKSYPVASIVKGMTFVLIDLASISELEAVKVSAAPLPEIPLDSYDEWNKTLLGLYFYVIENQSVPADGSPSHFALRTRMIVPGLEDPATGSAASTLACYLATSNSRLKGGRSTFDIVQGIEMGRRSEIGLEVEVEEDGGVKNVVLSGKAVVVSEGTIRI